MRGKRDLNERKIISFLVAAGATVIQMDRHAGFDLLVCHQGVAYIVEVKSANGKLTPDEELARIAIEMTGVSYNIVRSIEEAERMITDVRSAITAQADSASRIGGNPGGVERHAESDPS